jgi:peptidyl-prolyl cis-trans isomerase D
MIGTIRKHSKWLWAVIIVVTIVTFVFWGSSNSGGNSRKHNFGTIDGEPVTQEAYIDAAREAWVAFFLQHGGNPQFKFDEQRLTYERLFWLKKLRDYNIQVDDTTTFRAAQEFLHVHNLTLDKLAQAISEKAELSDFERFLRHNLGIEQLISVLSVSSDLVTMPEVRSLYQRDFQELATEAVFFSVTNYASMVVEPSPEALAKFYQLRLADYHLSERVQVSYVKLDPTNFLAEADQELAKITNLAARVEQVYQQRGSNYYPDVKTPEEAKKRILEDARRDLARGAAHKKAEALAEVLYEMKPQRSANLAVLAATNGLTVKTTAPFDEQSGPAELEIGLNFARAAFALSPSEPVSEQPVDDGDAFYLLALNKQLPSEIPTLDRIHDKVVADYKQYQALQLARRAGVQFAQAATNGIAQGKTFAAVAAEAKVKPISVRPFSLSTRSVPEIEDHLNLFEYKKIAFTAPVGKVADPVETMDGTVVVYVRERLPIDPAKMIAALPDFAKNVRLARRQEVITAWFQRELAKSMRDTPLAAPPPGPAPRRS